MEGYRAQSGEHMKQMVLTATPLSLIYFRLFPLENLDCKLCNIPLYDIRMNQKRVRLACLKKKPNNQQQKNPIRKILSDLKLSRSNKQTNYGSFYYKPENAVTTMHLSYLLSLVLTPVRLLHS